MKVLKWAVLSLVSTAVLSTISMAAAPAASQRLDGIAAVVNEDVILQSDVEEQLAMFLVQNQLVPDSMMVDTLRHQVLDQLINEKLIVAEAKRLGLTVNDAEVTKQVDQAIQDAKERLGSEEAFRAQLAKENLNEEKLRDKYRADLQRQMMIERLFSKQLPKKSVTPVEAESYFKTNRSKFPRFPAEVRVQVIQIPAAADSVADNAARVKAVAARKRIAAGEKFAKVAAELSDDTGTARSGGDLGFIEPGAVDPVVEKTLFALEDGEISDPVRSTFGWHILQAIERDTVKTRAGKDTLGVDGKPVLEVHARHVLIRVPLDQDDVERSKKQAERVRNEAAKGINFATLVHRYSKYQGQQGEDGDLGFISLGSLQPSIRAGLDSLEIGGVSEVLTNAIGFNIFKLLDRKPDREYTLEEIRAELPELVAQMKRRDRVEELVKGLRSKAHIEIRNS